MVKEVGKSFAIHQVNRSTHRIERASRSLSMKRPGLNQNLALYNVYGLVCASQMDYFCKLHDKTMLLSFEIIQAN